MLINKRSEDEISTGRTIKKLDDQTQLLRGAVNRASRFGGREIAKRRPPLSRLIVHAALRVAAAKGRARGHKKETNGRSNKLYRGEMRPSSVIHDANLTQLDFARPSRLVVVVGCFMVFRARV